MLDLILLATLNSQNINHLFPGFLTTLPPGLFAQSGRESPEQVFPLLASSKPSKAAHQPRTVREIIIQPKASRLQLHGSSETYFWAMNGRKAGWIHKAAVMTLSRHHFHVSLRYKPSCPLRSPPHCSHLFWKEPLIEEFSVHYIFARSVTPLIGRIYSSEHHPHSNST